MHHGRSQNLTKGLIMKWKDKPPKPPKPKPKRAIDGDMRVRIVFPIIPKLVNKEWRWLELCKVSERYTYKRGPVYDCHGNYRHWFEWVPVKWIDKSDGKSKN
jgi:hypothetical protein